ncbi:MAG TPA: MFS transporter, partial [Opitutaceae bacterium]
SEMLHSLFVTETLGLSLADLGKITTAALAVSFVMAYPVGLLIDRVGPRAVMIVGFAAVGVMQMAFVFWVNNLTTLTLALVAFKVAWVFVYLPMMPLIFRNTPLERRGSIFAAVQTTRAGAATLATMLAGGLVQITESYRMCYFLAAVACLVGLVSAIRLTAPRRAAPLPALA